MRLFFAFMLAASLPVPFHCGAAEPAKDSAATPPAAGTKPAWKIRRITLSQDGARVTLEDPASQNLVHLTSASTGTSRILSAAFSAESGELRVEALIDGSHLSLAQKAAELDGSNSSGPGPEDRKRYESLGEKGREQFREQLRAKFEDPKFRSAPVEERRAAIRALFEKVEKDNQMPR